MSKVPKKEKPLGEGTLSIELGELSSTETDAVLDARLGRVSVRQAAAAKKEEARGPNNWARDVFNDNQAGTMIDPDSGVAMQPKSGTFVLGEISPDDNWDKEINPKARRRGGPPARVEINMPRGSKVPRLGSAPDLQAPPRPVPPSRQRDQVSFWLPIVTGILCLIWLIGMVVFLL